MSQNNQYIIEELEQKIFDIDIEILKLKSERENLKNLISKLDDESTHIKCYTCRRMKPRGLIFGSTCSSCERD